MGSSRLDRDLDGVIDAGPGPALWDAFYPRLWNAAMPVKGLRALVGESAGPSSRFTDGGFWYIEKDLRRLNSVRLRRPFNERYCGNGDKERCARAVWAALEGIRATRTRYARTRPRNGSASAPACCRRRSATRTGRAGSSR